MLVAVSSIVIPKLYEQASVDNHNLAIIGILPEDIGSLTVPPLEDLGSKVQLITFPFKQCPFTIGRSVLGHRPGPDGCHAEVANLESAFACDEYVSGFEIKMNDAGVVDESQALRRVVSK